MGAGKCSYGEQSPMQIVCPHCATSYAISAAALGASGRTVRCSRCKEVWLARPEDAVEAAAAVPAMAGDGFSAEDAATEWERLAQEETDEQAPVVDSPPIAGWPVDASDEADWPSAARDDAAESDDR